jgi:uncharacterized membrane protein YeaQ/YmgE (transglycosylase-associated protein family)
MLGQLSGLRAAAAHIQREDHMPIITTAVTNLLIILVIGIIAGLAFNRYAGTWLSRQFVTRQSDITSALVGIAGAFIGFHVGVIFGLLPSPLMLYLAAIVGALIVLLAWRGR